MTPKVLCPIHRAGWPFIAAFAGATVLLWWLWMPLGLAGVGIGTLVPVTIAAVFVQFPAACARVGVSAWTVCRQAVWPAVWPVTGLLAVVWLGRPYVASSLPGLGALLVAGGLAYAALFVGCALPGAERRVYWTKLTQLAGLRRKNLAFEREASTVELTSDLLVVARRHPPRHCLSRSSERRIQLFTVPIGLPSRCASSSCVSP